LVQDGARRGLLPRGQFQIIHWWFEYYIARNWDLGIAQNSQALSLMTILAGFALARRKFFALKKIANALDSF